jgi:hypothetical protein
MVATAAALIALSLVYGAGRAASQESSPAGPGAWTQMAIPGLSDGTRVYAVRRAGELILVGTQGQGLWRSANGGATWQQVPQLGNAYVRDLWLGGANNQTVLAATFGAGLLRSTDGGVNWLPAGTNISSNLLYSLAWAEGVLYLGTADAGVWRSTDQGASWAATGVIDSPGAVAVAALSAQAAYAGSVNNGLYQTRDGGASWQQLGFAGKTVRALALDARDSQQLWASVLGDGVYHSADGGQSWQAASAGLGGVNVLALLVTGSGGGWQVLAGAHGGGLLRWTGSGWAAWGLNGLDVYTLAPWNDTLYAGTNSYVWEYGFPPTPTHTPTPTVTPTSTHTPTATATPTPGLALLLLRNDPASAIEPGEEILYTIYFRNGPLPLAQVAISNTIPLHVVLAPDSISAGGVSTGSDPGDTVSWDVGDLAASAAGSVSYRVQRPDSTPTGTPTATVTVTPTTSVTPTITTTPTSTTTPTATPTSTATVTPTPTRTPRSTLPATNAATSIATQTSAAAPSPMPAASPAAIEPPAQASLAATTKNGADQGRRAGVTAVGVRAPGSDVTILNAGATARWRFDGQPGQMTSNPVANPSVIWYLPLIYRR